MISLLGLIVCDDGGCRLVDAMRGMILFLSIKEINEALHKDSKRGHRGL
jgi:hypothetical protein